MNEQQPSARDKLSDTERALLEEIESLALCFSNKAAQIPESAWKFWFEAVKGFKPSEVRQVIRDWSVTSAKMITPADLSKALKTAHAQKREIEESRKPEKQHNPIPENETSKIINAMIAATVKNIPVDAGARRNRIKEAYGFFLTSFCQQHWRRSLNLSDDYNFEDTNGTFPLTDAPDERRSLYHDCHISFMREYEARHGLKLVYDKELANKRYPTMPLRWTGAAQSVGVNSDF